MSVTLSNTSLKELVVIALAEKIMQRIACDTELWAWSWGWLSDHSHYGVVFEVFSDGEQVWINCVACEERDTFGHGRSKAYRVIKREETITRKELALDLARKLLDACN